MTRRRCSNRARSGAVEPFAVRLIWGRYIWIELSPHERAGAGGGQLRGGLRREPRRTGPLSVGERVLLRLGRYGSAGRGQAADLLLAEVLWTRGARQLAVRLVRCDRLPAVLEAFRRGPAGELPALVTADPARGQAAHADIASAVAHASGGAADASLNVEQELADIAGLWAGVASPEERPFAEEEVSGLASFGPSAGACPL